MLRSLLLSGLLLGGSISASEVTPLSLTDTYSDITGMTFSPDTVRTDGLGEDVRLHFTEDGFSVTDSTGIHEINAADVDPESRQAKSVSDMIRLALTSKVKVSRFDNGSYQVRYAGGLHGGGAVGAWIGSTLGYGAVTLGGHLLILVAAGLTGPLAKATYPTLLKMCAIPIHQAATAAGIAGGVAGGVATGPV